ncbi:hypothetical protein [Pelomonas sp. Root1444]|uniref:hypothetical protein n=1 Tax=Pelomonas sp. Root1444 TaxID=1736464 RepID=UPI0012F9C858|nr:hypothetical protein [Pelomonas sp. Root1444]
MFASVFATAWALWWPEPVEVSPASETLVAPPVPRVPALGVRAGKSSTLREAALADPFFPRAASAGEPSIRLPNGPAMANATAAMAAALLPPASPRIAGSFTSPEDEKSVFLSDGGQLLAAKPGLVLSSGYEVEAIGPRELRLRHPAASEPVVLPMPTAAAAGTLP